MSYAGDVSAREAYAALHSSPGSVLVDVRTAAEWSFVGLPDLAEAGGQLATIEWVSFPSGERNPDFLAQVRAVGARPGAPVYLLCRSGVRSMAAAEELAAQGFTQAYNVVGGFEGPYDEDGHRGQVSGWKAEGLPWRQ